VREYGKVTSTGERILITASEGTIGFVDAKNRYKIPEELEVPERENPVLQYIPYLKQYATTINTENENEE